MTYARPYGRVALCTSPGMGALDAVAMPSPGDRQPPIWPLVVGSHGAWLEVRSSAADGACGVHGYPCQHPGVDVAGPEGTYVVSPENGVVVATGTDVAPFVGYGPWWVVVQGDDSGKFHLLAHLSPMTAALAPVGTRVTAGQKVGSVSAANHTHWEVRTKMVPDFAHGETNFTNNTDPLAWLGAPSSGVVAVMILGGAALLAYLMWRD